jgi:TonB family protein
MKVPWALGLRFALLLALWQIPAANGGEDQRSLRDTIEKAQAVMNIKANGMPGFELRGDIRIWLKKEAPNEGKYLYDWAPDGKWKEEITFNGYKRTRVGNGKHFWQVRAAEIENPVVSELDRLLKVRRELKIEEGDTLKRVHSESIEGVSVDCVKKASSRGVAQTLCFDPKSGELLRYTPETASDTMPWRFRWTEYSDYQQWEAKRFPRRLQGFNGKQKVIEVQFEEVRLLQQTSAEQFTPAKAATAWLDCGEGEAWKSLHKLQPVYPESARLHRTEGTVVLYAVIEEDGRVSNLHVLHSAGNELDQAASAAVSQWQYQRTTTCDESKGRAETVIDIIFELRH